MSAGVAVLVITVAAVVIKFCGNRCCGRIHNLVMVLR
jgi:hypothetical protein